MKDDYVECGICGKKVGVINHLHLKSHKMTTKEYIDMFPYAELSSRSTIEKRKKKIIGKPRSIETKNKISESNKKSWQENPNQGRTGSPLSEGSKKALSKKLMGHFVSEETRLKIGLSGIGREPWNKGLTKYDDDRIMGVSNKVREWNKESMTDDKRRRISQSLKKRYAEGMKIPNAKNGMRKDLEMSFRSSWEANYARILKFNNRDIEYEKDRFTLYEDDGTIANVYTPDFKIEDNIFIEIKGHADSSTEWGCSCRRCLRDKGKMNMMIEQYAEIKVILIGRKDYQELCCKYNMVVNNWEFTRWDNKDYIWRKEK